MDQKDAANQQKPSVLLWEQLDVPLKGILPNEGKVSHVITDYTPLTTSSFSGAPEFAFDAVIRINVTTEEDAKFCLQQLMNHSKCTYRYTKGRSPGLKRVLFKAEMHCQHQQKKLTSKQNRLELLQGAKMLENR